MYNEVGDQEIKKPQGARPQFWNENSRAKTIGNSIVTPPTSDNPSIGHVTVSTSNELRPIGAEAVFWIGGQLQPINMAVGDFWIKEGPIEDTTPPSAPTGLVATNISSTGFTLNWIAPEVDVSGYEVFINGSVMSSPFTTTTTITGLSGGVTYTATVRAKDAAGNWSQESAPISITTQEPSGSPTHSVFSASVPDPTPGPYDDGTPNITTATAFYTFGEAATGWVCTGGRYFVPPGSGMIGQQLVIGCYDSNADLTQAPLRSGTVTAVEGWNEVTWNAQPMNVGVNLYISSTTNDENYSATSLLTQDSYGSGNLYMASVAEGRSKYRIGTNAVGSPVNVWYGHDIIVSEAA